MGRIRGPIWKFFADIKGPGQETVRCIAVKHDESGALIECNWVNKDHGPTTLKSHLRTFHSNDLDKVIEWEKEAFRKKNDFAKSNKRAQPTDASGGGSTLDPFVKRTRLCDEQEKKRKLDRQFSLFISSNPHVPNSLGSNIFFNSFIQEATNGKWKPLGSNALMSMQDQLFSELKSEIRAILIQQKFLTIAVDFWTASDGTPFLGGVVHFFDHESQRARKIVFLCRHFPAPHTAIRIATAFSSIWTSTSDFGLQAEQILFYLTDGGSNMKKAFESDLPKLFSAVAAEKSVSVEIESDQEAGDHNLDASFTESDDFESIEEQFDRIEKEHMLAFGKKRLSCFVHSLQLTISHFLSSTEINQAIRSAREFIAKIKGRRSENI